jgi:hypothetical protein
MTSYPRRIIFLKKQIEYFFNTQTIKPDLFYLWLSKEEFPEMESNLPFDLLNIIKTYNINLMWCEKNEYCHKRWYVYPKHINDIVISIDDDHYYPNTLIETIKNLPIQNNVMYNIFSNYTYPAIYENIKFYWHCNAFDNEPSKYKTFNGQCVFMPNTFPLESISEENIKIRQKYCKLCDESWLMPFIKYNDIKIGSLPFKSHEIYEISKVNKSYDKLSKTIFHTLTLKDVQLYIVLRQFPHLKEKWEQLYPAYKSEYFDTKVDINELYNLMLFYMNLRT